MDKYSCNKYDNFTIYSIKNKNDSTDIYIGSTTDFSRRRYQHKKNCYNRCSKAYHYPLYKYIRALGGFDKFDISILEKYPCKTKAEGLEREKTLIAIYKANLNINKPIKTI